VIMRRNAAIGVGNVPVAQQVPARDRAMDLEGLGLEGLEFPSVERIMSHVVSRMFGDFLEAMGMRLMSSYRDLLVSVEDGSGMGMLLFGYCVLNYIDLACFPLTTYCAIISVTCAILFNKGHSGLKASSSPCSIICTLLPAVDQQPSPRTNRCGGHEFLVHNGRQTYNQKFWNGHMKWYTQVNGDVLNLMETAVMVLPSMLHESQMQEHEAARQWFNEFSCGIGNGWLLMTIYKKYAQVLVAIMNSPIVQMGRLHGWRPLFMFHNILLARSNFGKRRAHLCTVDRGAKTQIVLLGFWRMPQNDASSLQIVCTKAEGEYLAYGHALGE